MGTSVPQNLAGKPPGENPAEDVQLSLSQQYGWLSAYVAQAEGELYSPDDHAEWVGRVRMAADVLMALPSDLAGRLLEKEYEHAEEEGREPDIGRAAVGAITRLLDGRK